MGGITKADLLESESRINKEQQTARHGQNNLIQVALNKSEEALTENKLLNHSLETMKENIKKIEDKVDQGFEKIEDKLEGFMKELSNKFATKEEHLQNGKRIDKLESGVWWAIGTCATILLTGTLYVTIKYIANTL